MENNEKNDSKQPPTYEDSQRMPPLVDMPPPIIEQPSDAAVAITAQPINELEKLYTVHKKRLIFDFEKHSCCPGGFSGIHPEVKEQLPSELAVKGITHSQWRDWIVDLEKIQKKSPSIFWCMTVFCFPGFIVQSFLCAMFCPTSMDHPCSFLPCYFGDWFAGLRRWQDNINKTLNKHELHAKLVTYKPHSNAPKSKNYGMRTAGKDHHYEMSFLVIATDKSESLKLQSESWDHGVNDTCTSGIGRVL